MCLAVSVVVEVTWKNSVDRQRRGGGEGKQTELNGNEAH